MSDDQQDPLNPFVTPLAQSATTKKKKATPKKVPKGGKGIILSAREYCETNSWSPFKAPREIADDPKVNASIRLQASMVFITRIEPELQAVQIPVKKDDPPSANSTPVTDAKVMSLVSKT